MLMIGMGSLSFPPQPTSIVLVLMLNAPRCMDSPVSSSTRLIPSMHGSYLSDRLALVAYPLVELFEYVSKIVRGSELMSMYQVMYLSAVMFLEINSPRCMFGSLYSTLGMLSRSFLPWRQN